MTAEQLLNAFQNGQKLNWNDLKALMAWVDWQWKVAYEHDDIEHMNAMEAIQDKIALAVLKTRSLWQSR